MRFCGIDVSARPEGQQLATLHARRGGDGARELVATFYAPGDVDAVVRTLGGFGTALAVAVTAPAGPRLDLLAAGRPLRAQLGLPEGRFERHRVCDALLHRRGVPLYAVPSREHPPQSAATWQRWLETGFALAAALEPLGRFRPQDDLGRLEGPTGTGALRFGHVVESYPDAVFTALLGHRPRPKATPWGLQERIAALRLRGIVDADGGLWHRSLDELDAVAVAYAAVSLADGTGGWVGDPREAVVVLPVAQLAERYEPLPGPARAPLL